jgi:D-tyrosyl-tRNA(Tyr) deacylase
LRAVVQRVSRAEIRVEAEVTGRMDRGLLALIGIARGDTPEDVRQMGEKLAHLRVFPDDEGRMNRSLLEVGGTLGVVSQFTLLGDCRKGRRPSYVDAAPPEEAEPLIELLVETVRQLGVPVVTGRFRAKMDVHLSNEGPVTLLIDTRRTF